MSDLQPAEKPDFQDWRFRLLVSVSIGAIAGAYCLASMKVQNGARVAGDFTQYWVAARALIEGQNPYVVVQPGGPYDLIVPFIYPLPTAIAIVPFALWLSPVIAAAVFIGVSSALLAWGVTADGYHRMPLFLSLPFVWAANAGQVAPLLMAAALIPALGWLAPIKPTIGMAALSYKPSRIAIAGAAGFVLLSLIINPNWVQEWLATLPHREKGYGMPIAIAGGPLLLLAVLRWRRPEARLLLVMSIVPQLMLFYDQLLLWLVPRTWKQSLALSAVSWMALLIANRLLPQNATTPQVTAVYAPIVFLLIYMPCLLMVLMRRNEGELPAWLGPALALPKRIRGSAPAPS